MQTMAGNADLITSYNAASGGNIMNQASKAGRSDFVAVVFPRGASFAPRSNSIARIVRRHDNRSKGSVDVLDPATNRP